MTRLLLARHGQTVWHAENRYAGSSDVALTPTGLAQADALARWAMSARVGAVVASDLSRAVLTARPAAAALGLEVAVDARLREVDFGRGEGLTGAEMRAGFPEARAAFLSAPATAPLPEGESGVDALGRAWPALERLAVGDDADVLVVMHSTLMRLVLCRVLGIDPDRYRSAFPTVRNVAITAVTLGATPALHSYNVPVD